MRSTLLIGLVFVLTGCPRAYDTDGGPGRDAGPSTAFDSTVPLADGAVRDATIATDAGPPVVIPPLPVDSEPTPPPEILRAGTGGFLLRGTVLAADSVIAPGEVLVVGNTITCVAADCSASAMADTVTVIDTHGAVISPGLIDAHNHITYNFLTEFEPGVLFQNRDQWPDLPSYKSHMAPRQDGPTPEAPDTLYGQTERERQCAGALWGELRSIIHGTTTVQGQTAVVTCINRLARNAENYSGLTLPDGELGTSIRSVDDVTATIADSYVRNFCPDASGNVDWSRYAVHMQEGVSGLDSEFDAWAGRGARHTRNLLAFDGTFESMACMYSGVSVLIHSVSLTDADLLEVAATGSHIVWSPSSNVVLYGATADITRMLELDISLGMGPDWTPSGSDEMLTEMRYGYSYGTMNSIAALTPERIWTMATSGGAFVLGLQSGVGALAPGMRADISVFGRRAVDPYRALMDSRAPDVRLVMIDGRAYYGDTALQTATAINADCDAMDACGTSKFICLANTPRSNGSASDEPPDHLSDLRQQVTDMVTRFDQPLLDLIQCD